VDGSIVVAMLAGVAGSGLLLGGSALGLQFDPRPCWQKSDCTLKRANPAACEACPVFTFRDVPAEEYVTPELSLPPLRSFEPDMDKAA